MAALRRGCGFLTYCVGLTGGIGSGKSAASALFGKLGAAVVDTDEISRTLTAPGSAAIGPLREQFGSQFIAIDGGLDRARMRGLVFEDAQARRKLEGILHPLIRERARAAAGAAKEPYVMLVVPLLFETGAYSDLVQRVVVVDCDEARQIERAVARSGLAEAEVRRIVSAQMPRAERRSRADDVLDNDGDLDALRRQVVRLHAQYLDLARKA